MTTIQKLRHLSDMVSSLTRSVASDNNLKIETAVQLSLSKIGQTAKGMSASPKVKYKSVVRQLRRDQIENAALKSVLKRGFPASTLRVVAREAKFRFPSFTTTSATKMT
jgi:hypothetical protein